MVACPSCGAKSFLPSDLPPLEKVPCGKCDRSVMMPMMLRQFELRSEIASGGMGSVYRAWDTTLGREVAVKIMLKELVDDEEAVTAFAREARACAQLNHTHIIHVYTFDEHAGYKYLAMELADHGSLDSLLEKQFRLPELDVLDIGVKVASGLDAALKHGLLHLDIKPGNILFNADGDPKIVDFGLARKADSDTDTYAPIFGTPYYIAPERVRQQGDSFLCDMYSLAGTLYHALTGHVPFEAASVDEVVAAQVNVALQSPDVLVPEISQATSDVICRAMAKEPAYRYASYDEFIMALTASRSQLLIRQFAPQSAESKPESGGSRSWWRR